MTAGPQPDKVAFGPGFHTIAGRPVDAGAYYAWVGRWSRLFVPETLEAAHVRAGDRVLDVASGPGEAAAMALSIVGSGGFVVGADIAVAMLRSAQARLDSPLFRPVVTDGQILPFPDCSFDAVICQLGLQFFPAPEVGLLEFRRVLHPGRWAAACVISKPERAPTWGVLADVLAHYLPDQRQQLGLSFALSDADQLRALFATAGFRDVLLRGEARALATDSFEEYWAPIEAGVGSLPQAYLALPTGTRQEVRERVRAILSKFESDGRLVMSAEMLIAAGRA